MLGAKYSFIVTAIGVIASFFLYPVNRDSKNSTTSDLVARNDDAAARCGGLNRVFFNLESEQLAPNTYSIKTNLILPTVLAGIGVQEYTIFTPEVADVWLALNEPDGGFIGVCARTEIDSGSKLASTRFYCCIDSIVNVNLDRFQNLKPPINILNFYFYNNGPKNKPVPITSSAYRDAPKDSQLSEHLHVNKCDGKHNYISPDAPNKEALELLSIGPNRVMLRVSKPKKD